MPAPAIGLRTRWAPSPADRVDWGHPLVPTCGWIPSMGLHSLHGDACAVSGTNSGDWQYPVPSQFGPGHLTLYNQHAVSWVNRIGGSRTALTFVSTMCPTVDDGPRALIFSRDGINATGTYTTGGTPRRWSSSWNDDPATWGSTSGPLLNVADQMLAMVVTGSQIEWWIDGKLGGTQSYAAPSINFSLCGVWRTGDLGSNGAMATTSALYYVYDRPLSGVEVAELWADPFCFMRR